MSDWRSACAGDTSELGQQAGGVSAALLRGWREAGLWTKSGAATALKMKC